MVVVKKSGDFFSEYGKAINIIKMDVEGSQISILKSIEDYIYKHEDIKIIMKWNSDYRTNDDYPYLNRNFNFNLLLWESNMLKNTE